MKKCIFFVHLSILLTINVLASDENYECHFKSTSDLQSEITEFSTISRSISSELGLINCYDDFSRSKIILDNLTLKKRNERVEAMLEKAVLECKHLAKDEQQWEQWADCMYQSNDEFRTNLNKEMGDIWHSYYYTPEKEAFLLNAIENANLEEVKAYKGDAINCVYSNERWTPLMLASAKGNRDIIQNLLDREANTSYINSEGHSALSLSLQLGDTSIIIRLLAAEPFNSLSEQNQDFVLAKLYEAGESNLIEYISENYQLKYLAKGRLRLIQRQE